MGDSIVHKESAVGGGPRSISLAHSLARVQGREWGDWLMCKSSTCSATCRVTFWRWHGPGYAGSLLHYVKLGVVRDGPDVLRMPYLCSHSETLKGVGPSGPPLFQSVSM